MMTMARLVTPKVMIMIRVTATVATNKRLSSMVAGLVGSVS